MVAITITNDNIFDGCFCGGDEGVNAVEICRLADGSGFKVKVRRGIKPFSPNGLEPAHPTSEDLSDQYLHGSYSLA